MTYSLYGFLSQDYMPFHKACLQVEPGTYYAKENKTHSHRYFELCLSPEVVLLAPLDLLGTRTTLP